MANANALVSRIHRLEPPLDRPPTEGERAVSLELEEGRRLRLDPADPRSPALARVLEGIRRHRLLVYLEFDPATETILEIRVPHVARVNSIRRLDDDVFAIELDASHSRHLLRRSTAKFAELEKQLRESRLSRAPLVIIEDDAHEIFDVRPFIPAPDDPLPGLPELPPERLPLNWIDELLRRLWFWHWWPWWWFRCISSTRAQQVFNAMQATSCDPLSVPPPCIPFLYPDDGCWGRAHEMCRLMLAMGLKPRKVWIQGSLYVSTRNNPLCGVWWNWHVAPTLCVRGPRFYQTQKMVIDPSLFTTPVSEATWKSAQGDPNASLTPSTASIFRLWGNVTDPTYAQTNTVLATYRLKLQLRSIQVGPPPYAHCP